MQTEISFRTLFEVLRKSWLKILIIVLIITLSVGIFTTFFINKVYSSNVRFFVMNLPETSYISTAYTSGAQALVNDYVEILKSDPMMDAVIKQLSDNYGITGYTRNGIRNMVSTTAAVNTAAFTLTVSSTNKDHAFIIAECFKDLGNKIVTERSRSVVDIESSAEFEKTVLNYVGDKAFTAQVTAADFGADKPNEANLKIIKEKMLLSVVAESMDGKEVTIPDTVFVNASKSKLYGVDINKNTANIFEDIRKAVFAELNTAKATIDKEVELKTTRDSISILRNPERAKTQDSPNLYKNLFFAAFGSAILSYALFFLLTITDTIVRDPDDVKERINGTLIGVIPSWEKQNSK